LSSPLPPHHTHPYPPLRTQQEAKRGQGASAVFIARNRFAVLDRAAGVIQVRGGLLFTWGGEEGGRWRDRVHPCVN